MDATPNSSTGANFPRNSETSLCRSSEYGITALGFADYPLRGIDPLRRELAPPGGKPFAVNVLRSSDEQTVTGLAALLRAMESAGLTEKDLEHWGVIAAPRYFGKLGAGLALHKYATGGAWKVSPMVVPHHGLHAMSGTMTQALKINGPSFGAGGGPDALVVGLMSACTLLDDGALPGLWLVLSQCYPEPIFDPDATQEPASDCYAVALGFTPVDAHWRGLRLRIAQANSPVQEHEIDTDYVQRFFELRNFLRQGARSGDFGHWSCALDWRASLYLADKEHAMMQNKAA